MVADCFCLHLDYHPKDCDCFCHWVETFFLDELPNPWERLDWQFPAGWIRR